MKEHTMKAKSENNGSATKCLVRVHKWSNQNINGPGEQTINSAHSK